MKKHFTLCLIISLILLFVFNAGALSQHENAINTRGNRASGGLNDISTKAGICPVITLIEGSNHQELCAGTPITPIEYLIENDVFEIKVHNLPLGVTYTYEDGKLIISGTPLDPYIGIPIKSETYTYTIYAFSNNEESCSQPASTRGDITVNSFTVAAFTYTINESNPLEVTFSSDGSLSGVDLWWDFGDGSATVSGQNPTHTYSSVGYYDVSLTPVVSSGCVKAVTARIHTDTSVKSDFVVSNNTQCLAGNSFDFTNNSIVDDAANADYLWEFGDGGTSSEKDPVYNYVTTGDYVVKLTVTTESSSQMATRVVTVVPDPLLTVKNITACRGQYVDLRAALQTNLPLTSYLCYKDADAQEPLGWFIDAIEESCTVYVKVVNFVTGCESELKSFDVIVRPVVAAFSYEVSESNPLSVNFAGISNIESSEISNWHWNFGDDRTSTLQNPTHRYAKSGYYDVTLIIFSNGGCPASVKIKFHTDASVKPDFQAEPYAQCLGADIAFTNTSAIAGNLGADYLWNFGDNTTSVEKNPLHSYTEPGVYNVILQVSTSVSTQEIVKTVTVNPNPELILKDIYACEENDVDLTTAIVSYSNGTTVMFYTDEDATDRIMDTTISGLTPGSTLFYAKSINEATGCESLISSFKVFVEQRPFIQVEKTIRACEGDVVDLTNAIWRYSAGCTLKFYSWDDMEVIDPYNVEVVQTTTFHVKAVNNNGCESFTQPIELIVFLIPGLEVRNIIACPGQTVDLNDAVISSVAGRLFEYYLDPEGLTSTSNLVMPTEKTTYYVRAIGKQSGCSSGLKPFDVELFTPPTATIDASSVSVWEGSGTDLIFTLTGTAPWKIIYNDGATAEIITADASPHVIQVTPAVGITTYSLVSVEDADCMAAASGSVSITCTAVPPLTYTALLPADGAQDVEIDAIISVAFSRDISGIDLSGITITYGNNQEVGNVAASITDNVLFIGHDELEHATVYSVTIPLGTIDGYTEDITWSFTTVPGGTGNSKVGVPDIKIYPNPVKDVVYIESPIPVERAIFYDISGKIVLQRTDVESAVNISALPAGEYSVKLITAKGEVVWKVIKK